MTRQLRLLIAVGLLAASTFTVYSQYVFLHTTDNVTRRGFRELSLEQYQQSLDSTRAFPYRWRVAGPRLVQMGTMASGLDPHAVDVAAKIGALALSALFVMLYAARTLPPMAVLAVVAVYFAMTAAAYSSEGYSIYYTNDFLMVAGWNAAVLLAASRRWFAVAAVVFVTAWAKESVMLIALLAVLEWRGGRASLAHAAACLGAFAVPFATLRAVYPAPVGEWAWWHDVMLNVPFLRMERDVIVTAFRDNAKLALFFNIWGWLAARVFVTTRDGFQRNLAVVAVGYLAIMYVVVYLRELRHFLPLLIIVLPPAMSELQRLMRGEPAR